MLIIFLKVITIREFCREPGVKTLPFTVRNLCI